jgi:phosphatidylinositol alpha-1,6-mannosyltransferase
LITEVFPPKVGGSGRWFWELYRRMSGDDYVVVAGDCPGAAEVDASYPLRVERLPLKFDSWGIFGLRSATNYYRAWQRLCRLAQKHDATMLHAGCALPEGWLARRFKQKRRLPYIVYVHGEELRVFRSSRELTWMARRVYCDADLVICNSENTAALLKQEWPVSADRVRVLHPGVDTTYFQPAVRDPLVRRQLGWNERPVVLTVGRLQKRKGHDLLIKSLPVIRETIPNILYAIIGDGEERTCLERLTATLGMQDHVIFHGRYDDEQIRRAYQQCDLFSLPNREVNGDFEGFGIVLIEAQACGKPVITGASGGTIEAVSPGMNEWVIDCSRTPPLEFAITRLLGNAKLRETLGFCSRKWAEDRFSWERLAVEGRRLFEGWRSKEEITGPPALSESP